MKKLINYLKASKAELNKVVWPKRKTVRNHTVVVIIISLAIAAFLGAIDYIIETYVFALF